MKDNNYSPTGKTCKGKRDDGRRRVLSRDGIIHS